MFRRFCSDIKIYSRRYLSLQKIDGFDWKKQEQILMEPFEYMHKVPVPYYNIIGPAFNHWLQVPKEKLEEIQEAVHILCTWTILLDDIQDDSAFRYGVPATHKVYGIDLTINAASNALLVGAKKILELGHPLAPKIFWRILAKYHVAQGTNMYWRNNCLYPPEQVYIEMSRLKNGYFFSFPVELLQLFSSHQNDYSGLANNIGLYYSVLDDYYNLFQPKALEIMAGIKKGTDDFNSCSDVTECKITLPIIHASQFPDVASELGDILRQRTSDPKLKDRVIALLKKHRSDEYMRDVLRTMETDIRTEIEQFSGNAILTKYMDELNILED